MRPKLKRIFFSERRPKVYFHTSNHEKFLQARTVFDLWGLPVTHFRSRPDPYDEVYDGGRLALLRTAIAQVRSVIGHASIFFVEDTSIRISALSKDGQEVPGLRAKEWFQEIDFATLDQRLRERGDRRASVRSDIALHLPSNPPVVRFFHGETMGTVAEKPPTFAPNPSYPWLTPLTFNGWFIPEGADRPLGAMAFEGSLEFDFRVRALTKLLERLVEYTAILNIPSAGFERLGRVASEGAEQIGLFDPSPKPRVLVVVGYSCAGKTEFGSSAGGLVGVRHIEASAVLRDLADAQIESLEGFDLAKRLLRDQGADVVAREIADRILPYISEDTVVITGLRTIEEIAYLRRRFDQTRVIFLRADRRTRYQRQIQRARDEVAMTMEDFERRDQDQESFGLLAVAQDLADDVMDNDGTSDRTLNLFQERVRALLQKAEQVPGVSRDILPRVHLEKERLYRCLKALQEEGVPLTAAEIAAHTNDAGWPIAQRNVNQALRGFPQFAERRTRVGGEIRYEITHAGLAYIRQREEKAERARRKRSP